MVESTHRTGHVMGIKTITEVVENKQIPGKLHGIGVDYAQGYDIDEPSPLQYQPHSARDSEITLEKKDSNTLPARSG